MSLETRTLPDYVGSGRFLQSLTPNQTWTLEKKYLVRDEDGEIAETTPQAVYRMARTMAGVEKSYGKTDEQVATFTKEFYDMIADGFFSPAGRIWTNAGTHVRGLFNCYVLPVEDTIELEDGGIFMEVAKAAVIHKNGGGTGYNFSKLRPRGMYVQKSKGIASGPVSFIGQFDKETEVINSGNRRGANMGILNVDHPDIVDFIHGKATRGEMTNFNVSVGASDAFMQAVDSHGYYELQFPKGQPFQAKDLVQIVKNIEQNKIGGSDVGEQPKSASLRLETENIVPGKTNVIDSYSGKVAGRVSERGTVELNADYVMQQIAELAWKTADPGMIFLDAINRDNPLPNEGDIEATNPCGEQPLHPYDACNLGSIILSEFVIGPDGEVRLSGRTSEQDAYINRYDPSDPRSRINWSLLEKVAATATRFMDNVNDASEGPIPQIKEKTMRNRRIGMGVMGWADMLVKLGISYDSPQAIEVAEEVMGFITDAAKRTSVELAKEKDVFLAFPGSVYDTGNPEDRVRNVDRTTIAPTGTISMVYEVASGIEPFFAIAYKKHIRGGDVLPYFNHLFAAECNKRGIRLDDKLFLRIDQNHGSVQGLDEIPQDMQRIFRTAHDLGYESHVAVQAAFQRHTDNAVSKTINMVHGSSIEDVRNAYVSSWKSGNKGITVYRDGCKDVQVLTTGRGDLERRVGTVDEQIKVPPIIPSLKFRQSTPWGNAHVFVDLDPSHDYRPVEVFASLGNAGKTELADMEAMGRMTSLWLRSGGDIRKIIEQLKNIGSGVTEGVIASRDGAVQSLPMGFARALERYVLLRENYAIEDALLGKIDYNVVDGELSDMLAGRINGNSKNNDSDKDKKKSEKPSPGLKCPDCGTGRLSREEGCLKCHSCGYSKC